MRIEKKPIHMAYFATSSLPLAKSSSAYNPRLTRPTEEMLGLFLKPSPQHYAVASGRLFFITRNRDLLESSDETSQRAGLRHIGIRQLTTPYEKSMNQRLSVQHHRSQDSFIALHRDYLKPVRHTYENTQLPPKVQKESRLS